MRKLRGNGERVRKWSARPNEREKEFHLCISLPLLKFLTFCQKTLYPCSTKRREVLENPSPTPKISRDPRDFPRVSGNLKRFPAAMGFAPRDPKDFPREIPMKAFPGNDERMANAPSIQMIIE